ncbi:MAG: hypothetical protein A2V88_10945, partial [Elusimicrobia bacterium RBG_16_66_12]
FVSALMFCALMSVAFASRTAAQEKKVGKETCAGCHAEVSEKFSKTFHGRKSLSSAKLTDACESCHGAGGAHADGGGDVAKIINPKKLDASAAADLCLKCHTNKNVMMWKTSHHAQNGLSCLQCHSVHEGTGRTSLKDRAVFEERIQTETCLKCHKKQKADMRLASHHPLPEGKMSCVSCHNPHGGIEGSLKADSSEELCARCHAEKAGPFANEHPPVSDSCMNCHLPHGSANDKLLKQAQPYLCLSCHKFPHTTKVGAFTGVSLSREEQRGSCMDCHKEIHGSDRKAALKD